jgi:hypothetical protein
MTALSANKQRPVRLPPGGLRMERVKLAGYTNYSGGSTGYTTYKGSVMMCDVNDTDGYFAPKAANAASGDLFGGIAMEQQVVGSGDAADGSVECVVAANGVWGFPIGGLAITDLGAVIYASDDATVTSSSSNAIAIGILEDVDATYAWVNIADYFMKAI